MDSIMRRLLKLQERIISENPMTTLVYRSGKRVQVPAEKAFITALSLCGYADADRVERFETDNKELQESMNNAFQCMRADDDVRMLWAAEYGKAIVPAGFWEKR